MAEILDEEGNMLDATAPGSVRYIPLGEAKGLVFYSNGDVGFRHVCDRSHRNAGTLICSPLLALGAGHTITETALGVTVRASIVCADCGTHGFVTDSRWEPC
jgi:hypothetical protein